jgi:hypothetical protein
LSRTGLMVRDASQTRRFLTVRIWRLTNSKVLILRSPP